MSIRSSSYRYDNLEKQAQNEEFKRLSRQSSSLSDVEEKIWVESGIAPGASILDVGCGSGAVTRRLASYAYLGKVVGVDSCLSLIEKGRQTYVSCENVSDGFLREDITLEQGDVYDLPFSEETFDVVHARFLFQHLSDPIDALSSIWRVLKPGGLLCVVDVDKGWSGLSPEPATSVALDKAIIEKQLSQGGDPWIGRKLSYYLNSASFSDVKTSIKLVDSDQMGFSKYVEMLAFSSPPKGEEDELASLRSQAQPDIHKLLNSRYAWAGFALFAATGRKAHRL